MCVHKHNSAVMRTRILFLHPGECSNDYEVSALHESCGGSVQADFTRPRFRRQRICFEAATTVHVPHVNCFSREYTGGLQ